MIIHTPAIVIRTIDYRESSKIVTLFTQTQGKVAVIVKGIKKSNSNFSGLLEIGNILDIVMYYKESRSVQNLTKASYKAKTYDIRVNLEKMAISTATLEMIDQLVMDNLENEAFYKFTENFLIWLHETKHSPRKLFPYIQLRLAEIMGIALCYESTDDSGTDNYLNIEEGIVSNHQSSGLSYKLTFGQVNYIKQGLGPQKGLVIKSDLSMQEIKNLIYHLDVYMKHHIDGLKDRRSDKIFYQILN
ncbi:MAG: DNA repair protein RecO [Balneolales bacterium]